MTFSGNTNKILLSFDLEEFDIPLEYGQNILQETQWNVTNQGLDLLLSLLSKLDLRVTFFTTAAYALQHPEKMKEIAQRHEIGSHGFHHSQFEDSDLLKSKQKLEEIIQKPVYGFRRPRFQKTDSKMIEKAGYLYDSSKNPIFLPGRYNNLHLPRTAYKIGQLLEIPISATPYIRIPLFWLAFKNLPYFFIQKASQFTLKHDGYLNILFHPWEFADLHPYRLPSYIKRLDSFNLLHRLEKYLRELKTIGEFIPMNEFCENWKK